MPAQWREAFLADWRFNARTGSFACLDRTSRESLASKVASEGLTKGFMVVVLIAPGQATPVLGDIPSGSENLLVTDSEVVAGRTARCAELPSALIVINLADHAEADIPFACADEFVWRLGLTSTAIVPPTVKTFFGPPLAWPTAIPPPTSPSVRTTDGRSLILGPPSPEVDFLHSSSATDGTAPQQQLDRVRLSADAFEDYRRSIRATPLLSAAEEVSLAKAIEAGVLSEDLLSKGPSHWRGASEHELRTLAELGRQAKRRFVASNLRLVVSLAMRFRGRGLEIEDLVQEGNLGLIRAVEKYDFAQGNKFSTYATWWIRQSISRGLADSGRLIRFPVHVVETLATVARIRREEGEDLTRQLLAERAELTLTKLKELDRLPRLARIPLHEFVELELDLGEALVGEVCDEEDRIEALDAGELLEALLGMLSDREREVLERRQGFFGEPETLEEIGQRLGVTRERIRQIEGKAVEKLRSLTTTS